MPLVVGLLITVLPPARRFFGRFADGQIADNEMIDSLPTGLERFTTLELPVTLLTGENSPAHLRERSDRLARVLPHPPICVRLAGQGHGANIGAPDAVAAAVAQAASVADI
jgi:pimeloyl-ACP methyl ester carboxylesterase